MRAGADREASGAAVELQRFRERMLLWMVGVSLAAVGPITVHLTPRAVAGRNYPYLVFSWFVVLDLVLVAVTRRRWPLALRAWLFAVPGLVHVSLMLPAYVDPVGLASAVGCSMYLTALAGIRHGAVNGALLISVLIAGAIFAPETVDPAQIAALRQGPLRAMVVALGTIPLVVMGVVAVHIMLRGLVRSIDSALAGLREAKHSERRFRGVFELAPDPMALVRMPGARYLAVNSAFERVFGWPRAEVVGKRPVELQILRDADQEILEQRLRGGQTLEAVELTAHRRDGSEVQVILGARVGDLAGEHVALVIGHDVTQQRRLESALRQAQRIETTGKLAGGIAHNFRNALGAVLPNLDVCLEEAPEALRPALRDAHTAASAAVDLAGRLTRLARNEPAHAPTPVAMGGLLSDLVALCRSTFGTRVAITVDVAEDGVVLADRGELHQVFLNLLLNARDALERVPNPRIAVRLRRSADARALIASVSDTGAGMDDATLRRLGEPFFTTKGSTTGTGLGLTTAFAAVRAAGGRVTVESQPGVGSTFTVELPASDARPGEQPRAVVRLGGRALVVDDDPLVLEALGRQLGGLGIEVELLQDARRAAGRLRDAPGAYSLLVTDVEMPGLDGRELIAQARAVAPSLPVLVITGSPSPEPVQGAQAVLSKPVSLVELAAAAARCLGVGLAPRTG